MPEDDYFHNDPNVFYTETNVVGEDTETIAIGCTCSENSQCQNENESCQCIEMSGGILNYTSDGKLIVKENPIFECRPLCQCVNCSNRVVQNGPVSGLVVQDFGTKGLGLICQTPISKGTVFEFIIFVRSYFQHSVNVCELWRNFPIERSNLNNFVVLYLILTKDLIFRLFCM